MNKETDGYHKALSVHLHDQRVIIADDPYSFSTDSGVTDDLPEYKVPYRASKSLEKLVEGVTGRVVDLEYLGFERAYAEYPARGLKLLDLAVSVHSERLIDIRMTLVPLGQEGAENVWIENWTYSGSYTVRWDDEASDG